MLFSMDSFGGRFAMNTFVALLVPSFCVAFTPIRDAETAQQVLEMVRMKYESIDDARLRFSQRTQFEMTKIEQNVTGTLFLKKGNKYRVEFSDQTIITNGETVWSYSVSTNQVLIDNFRLDQRSISPEKILAGAPVDFYSTLLGKEKLDKSETFKLKLMPKDDQSFIRSLKLWVDDSSWLIKKAEISDVSGKQTEYLVKDVEVNIGLGDSDFVYQIPEGVDVVDLR
jgi:outer membrane lipoprotein-sorting protein